jgi:hypothetical protein
VFGAELPRQDSNLDKESQNLKEELFGNSDLFDGFDLSRFILVACDFYPLALSSQL